jgi:hypothetical protein
VAGDKERSLERCPYAIIASSAFPAKVCPGLNYFLNAGRLLCTPSRPHCSKILRNDIFLRNDTFLFNGAKHSKFALELDSHQRVLLTLRDYSKDSLPLQGD